MKHTTTDLMLGATAAVLFCANSTLADVYVLEPGGGPATQVQDAIDLAQDGDTIELGSGYWTYGQDYLPFDLDGKRLTIKGEDDGWVVLGPDGKERFEYIITVHDSLAKGTSIQNLWFVGSGPDTGGVISVNNATLVVDKCLFMGLQGLFEDGITAVDSTLSVTDSYAISNSLIYGDVINCNNCTLTVDQCNFIDYNRPDPPRSGTGIYAVNGHSTITNTVFDRADSPNGVGLAIVASWGLIENCEFIETYGGVNVGASGGDDPLHINNCIFERTTSMPSNGTNPGRGVLAYGRVIITNSTFTGPDNGEYGGGIELVTGGIVAACTISDCSQFQYGGGATATGFSIFWGCDFINNKIEREGGGLNLRSGAGGSIVLDCRFEGNTALNGGGVSTRQITGDVPVRFYDCVFKRNEAQDYGGGIAAMQFGGPLALKDCCFEYNDSGVSSTRTAYSSDYGGYDRPIMSFEGCTYVKSSTPPPYTVDLGGNLRDILYPGDDTGIMLYTATGDFEAPGLDMPTDKHSVYAYDQSTGESDQYFDGWYMLQNDTIDAVARLDRDELIISLKGSGTTTPTNPNEAAQPYEGEDLLAFTATAFGFNTTGEWRLYFDGSDVGIPSGSAGDIDALAIEDDGALLLSFAGRFTHPDLGQIEDESVVRFRPTQLGEDTSGTWEYLFDSAYSGLSAPGEDIDALTIQQQWPDFTDFFLSTTGNCTIPDVTATDEDIIEMMWFRTFATLPPGWTHLWASGLNDLGFSSSQANLTGLHWAPVW
ncbi:MAG: right-handed parallel beta-helix repeat-containing protein [Phycisphaerales bacterium]|nr:right-handed parallel beta-helix repeat-containing protein [Phycisphaerales bacterium]